MFTFWTQKNVNTNIKISGIISYTIIRFPPVLCSFLLAGQGITAKITTSKWTIFIYFLFVKCINDRLHQIGKIYCYTISVLSWGWYKAEWRGDMQHGSLSGWSGFFHDVYSELCVRWQSLVMLCNRHSLQVFCSSIVFTPNETALLLTHITDTVGSRRKLRRCN